MEHNEHNLIFALKNNILVSIDNVESGLKCECFCPACGERLVAKKGSKMMHHFAHHSGTTCEYAHESSLHLMAKDILSKASKFKIPPVYVKLGMYRSSQILAEASEITVDHVELEKKFDHIVPDIVIYSGNKKFFVEIYVTHKIDNIKEAKIIDSGFSTIEIDLSKINSVIDENILTEILINDIEHKTWIYNSHANKYEKAFMQSADELKITERTVNGRLYHHVDNCPINARSWKGSSYANYDYDCGSCIYKVGDYIDRILCTGRLRLASVSDFKKSFEERKKEHDDLIDTLREHARVARYGRANEIAVVDRSEDQIVYDLLQTFNELSIDDLEEDPLCYISLFGSEDIYRKILTHKYHEKSQRIIDKKKKEANEQNKLMLGYEEIKNNSFQQDKLIYDSFGERWIKCILCDQIKPERYFASYGGNTPNLGTCSDCSRTQK